MNILAMDTSTIIGSVAVLRNEQIVGEVRLNVEVTHTEKLLPAIEKLLGEIGFGLNQMDGLALAIGPGSFTGLRIGLATAKGFASAYNLPIVGISSLLALAHNAAHLEKPVVPLMDAKRKEVYAAAYQFHHGNWSKTLLLEEAIAPRSLCAKLKELGHCILLGDGAWVYKNLFEEELGDKMEMAKPEQMRLKASWIAQLAKPKLESGEGRDWQQLSPNYIRLSDAKERVPS